MHNRLLPLNPPIMASTQFLSRFTMPRLTLPSLPWLEFGFFGVMIAGLIAIGS